MHVLISGGTGTMGSALSSSLLSDGHEVTILTRNASRASKGLRDARLLQWDATSTEGWGQIIETVDAVVHLAGESLADGRWTDERKKRIRDSRVLTGKALVAAIEQANRRPSVLVQSSAVGYYGPRGDEMIVESASPGADFLSNICFEWEAATAPVESLGLRRAVARTGIVLSMDGGALPRIVLPFRFFVGGKIGSGQQRWSWIHVADQIRALRFLIENEQAAGPFNLSSPNPVKNQEFAATVGKVMGRPSLFPVPGLALRAVFGEMATVLLDGQRAIPSMLVDLGFEFNFPDLETALRDLLR